MQIVTIGGYGFTEPQFIDTLRRAGVDTFIDVRQRRGMRGSKYAFLNSKRLQALLASARIRYIHALNLAPTTTVRNAQKAHDQTAGISKQKRAGLSAEFVQKYRSEILTSFDPATLMDELGGANTVALFCVEAHPSACHRSLAAEHLISVFGSGQTVEHLSP